MSASRLRQALVDYLHRIGTQYVFGNPGSTEVPLLDASAEQGHPGFHLVLHESIAVAMADGYAQFSGRPGVVLAHATPGVANILGGLFLAASHHSPVVVIAGQQDSRLLGRRPFLASDLVATVDQHTKWAYEARRPGDVLPALRRAVEIALQPPRGPVLLSIPKDLYEAVVAGHPPLRALTRPVPDPDALRAAAATIAQARHPVLLSGNGVGAAGDEAVALVVRLAELIGARVHSEHNATLMHFPSAHPQYLGGNAHGIERVRPWLTEADVLIAIGCDLFMEDHWSPDPIVPADCRIVQIDVDEGEIGRVHPVHAAVVGDLTLALQGLLAAVEDEFTDAQLADAADRRAATAQIRHALDAERAEARKAAWDSKPIRMPRLYVELRALMPDDAIMVDEAVNMASYLHEFFEFREPGTLLSSKQSWLGWGWGAALGVQLARPSQPVVAVLGDGSALFGIQALGTAALYEIPVTTVILNNGRYVAVENHLRSYGGFSASTGRYVGTELPSADFVAIAQGFGVPGRRIDEPGDLADGLRAALDHPGPSVLEVRIDPDDAGWKRDPIPRPRQ